MKPFSGSHPQRASKLVSNLEYASPPLRTVGGGGGLEENLIVDRIIIFGSAAAPPPLPQPCQRVPHDSPLNLKFTSKYRGCKQPTNEIYYYASMKWGGWGLPWYGFDRKRKKERTK